VAALRDLIAPTARVHREGVTVVVPAAELVVGDLVEIEAGDRVPADLELVDAASLGIDEAALTGEAEPADKRAGGATGTAVLAGDRDGEALCGTFVVRGHGTGVVIRTGRATEVGHIAGALDASPPAPLERELRSASGLIAAGAFAVGAAVAVVGLLRADTGDEVADALLAGVALAVAAIPEGLVAVVTTCLALGAQRMARTGTIVRRLKAIEALGATSVLCTDKTGTLTVGRLSVADVVAAPGVDLWPILLRCTDPASRDPLEQALVAAAPPDAGHGVEARLADRPFDAATRSMATVVATAGGAVVTVKGAPEAVLPRCRVATRSQVADAVARFVARGLRVLVVATGPGTDLDAADLDAVGVIALRDPLRPSARDAALDLTRAGIGVVMVTGDHLETARAVARASGLPDVPAVAGADLAELGPADRTARLRAARVVARVDPAVKADVVRAHREAGDVVAMIGDGVNDAPALRAADIGVAVAGTAATDVARDAADLVVTHGDLGVLVDAVREGRTIYRNLTSVVAYLLTGNV
jgi:Ca2+-transporting ATPase